MFAIWHHNQYNQLELLLSACILHNNLISRNIHIASKSTGRLSWIISCFPAHFSTKRFIYSFTMISLLSRNWAQRVKRKSVTPIYSSEDILIAQNSRSQKVAASPCNRAVAIGEGLTKHTGTILMSHIHRLPIILSCF